MFMHLQRSQGYRAVRQKCIGDAFIIGLTDANISVITDTLKIIDESYKKSVKNTISHRYYIRHDYCKVEYGPLKGTTF